MKILVTGATGLVGRHLLPALAERGYEIIVLTREPDSAGFKLPVVCEVLPWKPIFEIPDRDPLEGVDAVINLAGAGVADKRWSLARKNEISRSRQFSTRHLIKALKGLYRKPSIFISASAIGYYGEGGEHIFEENSPLGNGFLAEVCRDWEQEVFEAQAEGLRTVALRIGFILGKGGVAMDRMLPPFRLGLGGTIGFGKQWMSWVHVQDVVGIILYSLDNSSVQGVYNAVSPNPLTNREFTKILGKVLQRPTLFPIPGLALKIALGEMSQLLLGSQRVSSQKIEDAGYSFQYPALESALHDICDSFDHKFQTEIWVPHPVETVFDFFKEAKNLETITPKYLNFKIVEMSTDIIEEGCRLNYRMSLHGIPIRWQSKIEGWNPPYSFSDIQMHGPYAYWRHTHEFVKKDGGTLIRDKVVYRLPMGIPGEVIAGAFVRGDLQGIFTYRRKKVLEIFGTVSAAGQSS